MRMGSQKVKARMEVKVWSKGGKIQSTEKEEKGQVKRQKREGESEGEDEDEVKVEPGRGNTDRLQRT